MLNTHTVHTHTLTLTHAHTPLTLAGNTGTLPGT